MKRVISILAIVMVFMPMKHSLAGSNPYVGEISLFAGDFAPKGYMFCHGQVLKVDGNEALYAIFGNTYGGNGYDTFALPNFQEAEKSLGGVKYIISTTGLFPLRH